jgi:hypothetical protein
MEQLRRKDTLAAQQNLRTSQDGIATGPRNRFHTKLAALLEKRGFTEAMHRLCRPYYRPDSRKICGFSYPHAHAYPGTHV